MPNSSMRPWLPRSPLQIPFLYKGKPAGHPRLGVGWTRNLSEEGACVEVADALSPQVPLRFFLRTDQGGIGGEAKVVWTDDSCPTGGVHHGIVFARLALRQRRALADLLLFQGRTRAAGFRFPLDLAVTCRAGEAPEVSLSGRIADLSRGGLSLRLAKSLLPGTGLEVILHTPRGPLPVKGVIVWADPAKRCKAGEPVCHGVRFTSLTWTDSLALSLLLASPLDGLPWEQPVDRGIPSLRSSLPHADGRTAAVASTFLSLAPRAPEVVQT